MKQIAYTLALVTLLACTTSFSEPPGDEKLSAAAQHFLDLLEDQQPAATYPLDDEERYNWHFTPRERQGVPLKNMSEDQQQAALQLMKVCLSEAGYAKAMDIRELEQVLRYVENRPPNDTRRDPMNYSFTIFGEPTAGEAWGWRVEGHHLSLNYTAIDKPDSSRRLLPFWERTLARYLPGRRRAGAYWSPKKIWGASW